MFARPSFFADIVQPSASANISRAISLRRPVRLPRLALLDEPGVLGEAAGVEEERLAVAIAQRAHAAQVLQRHRLAAAGVVRDGHHHERHAVAVALAAARSSAVEIDVALERMHAADGTRPSAITRSRASAPSTSMLARVVSKWLLLGTISPGCSMRVEQDALGGAPLVRRDDVREAGEVAARRRGSGRTSGCRRTTRRPASARPTAPTTSRRCRSRSADR